jgi:hypothetical protein
MFSCRSDAFSACSAVMTHRHEASSFCSPVRAWLALLHRAGPPLSLIRADRVCFDFAMLWVERTSLVLAEPGSLAAFMDACCKIFEVGFLVDVEQSFAGPMISHYEDPRELAGLGDVSHVFEPSDHGALQVRARRLSHFRIQSGEQTERSRGTDVPLDGPGKPDRRR